MEEFKEGEYCNAIWRYPHNTGEKSVIENMMEVSEVNEEFKSAVEKSSLGVRLIRKRMEVSSLMGLSDDGNAGGVAVDQLQLREMEANPFAADHYLEECQMFLESENPEGMSKVEQVRHLVRLLGKHKKLLDDHCSNIENGVEDEKEHLWQTLKRLESSVRKSLGTFSDLRTTGVETLAPPLPGIGKQMMLANKAENEKPVEQAPSIWGNSWGGGNDDDDYYQEEDQQQAVAALRDAAHSALTDNAAGRDPAADHLAVEDR